MRSEGTGPLAKAAGLLAVGAVVAAAWLAGRSAWAAQAGFSLLTLAIVIGMLAGNTVYPRVANLKYIYMSSFLHQILNKNLEKLL